MHCLNIVCLDIFNLFFKPEIALSIPECSLNNFRTPDLEEETMTPFSGRNFTFSEIYRENMVSMLIPHKNVIHAQRRGAGKDF